MQPNQNQRTAAAVWVEVDDCNPLAGLSMPPVGARELPAGMRAAAPAAPAPTAASETARIHAILMHPDAIGRDAVAERLAFHSFESLASAVAILRSSAKDGDAQPLDVREAVLRNVLGAREAAERVEGQRIGDWANRIRPQSSVHSPPILARSTAAAAAAHPGAETEAQAGARIAGWAARLNPSGSAGRQPAQSNNTQLRRRL